MILSAYASAMTDPEAVLHLREHRERTGLSAYAVAKRAGVSPTTVLRLERGESGGVDFGVLGAIARVLGVEPGALFAPPSK